MAHNLLNATQRRTLIAAAIREIKADYADEWRGWDNQDWYGNLETVIDGMLHKGGQFETTFYVETSSTIEGGVYLERLVFDAILKIKRRRDPCDPLA